MWVFERSGSPARGVSQERREDMHKKGGKRGGDGGSGHEAPARRRKPPATLLESVHFHAMERADYKPPKNHGGLFHHGPHGVTDEIIKRKFSGPPCLLPRTQTRQFPLHPASLPCFSALPTDQTQSALACIPAGLADLPANSFPATRNDLPRSIDWID